MQKIHNGPNYGMINSLRALARSPPLLSYSSPNREQVWWGGAYLEASLCFLLPASLLVSSTSTAQELRFPACPRSSLFTIDSPNLGLSLRSKEVMHITQERK